MRRSEVGSGERYRPAEPLGEDALGALWSGTDTLSGDPVIVRILHERLLADAGAVHQATNALERIRGHEGNPHLPRVLHHTLRRPGEGPAFVVWEGSGVETLARRLERGGLSPRVALHVTAAVADGLAAAHEAWVYHGALSASSVVVDRGAVVKVVDVGLGDLLGPEQRGAGAAPNFRDRSGADVLAVATLFEQMVSGAARWQATGGMEPATPRVEVPAAVEAMMRRARSPHLLQRPRMAELAAALAPALEAVPEVTPGTFGLSRPDVAAAGPGSTPVMLPTGPRGAMPDRPAPPRPDDRAAAAAAGDADGAEVIGAVPPSLAARTADTPKPAGDALLSETAATPETTASPPRWRGAALAAATLILLAMLGVGVYLGVDALRQPSAPPPRASLTPQPPSSPSGVATPTPSSVATPSGVASVTPSGNASPTPSSSPSATPSIVPATVPNVVGLSVERATERIEGAGLVVGTITSVPGSADTVVSSDPTQGEAVVAGTVVNLSVGDGSSG